MQTEESNEESDFRSEMSESKLGKVIETVKRAQTAVGNFRDGQNKDGSPQRLAKSAGPRVSDKNVFYA